MSNPTLYATFAAGCFWGVQYRFSKLDGVLDTAVGYEGGHLSNPSYKQVCYTDTGHAEVVRVAFDAEKISYETLVRYFYAWHDPTTLNRQGPDVGTQYRSAIFYHDDAQKQVAEAVTHALNQSEFGGGIVTQIVPAQTFWPAEEYHQHYLLKRGATSCGV
jgi:peptide-methionine (S)-S-oxide reductase